MMQLQNKVTIVTGGGRGIGRAIAARLGAEGARSILLSRSLDQLLRTESELRAQGHEVKVFQADIGQQQSAQEVMRKILDEYGPVDILINNAGVQGPIGQLAESDMESWIGAIQTNLIG